MDHQDLSFPDPDDGLSATPLKSILPHPQQHDSASQAIIMGKENTGKSKNSETNDRSEKRCELLEITLCKTYVPKKKTILPRAGKGPRFGSFFSHDHPHDSQGKVCYTKVGPGRKGLSESGLRIASYLGLYLSFQIL